MKTFRVQIIFHQRLVPLLLPKHREKPVIYRQLNHQTSVKDLIEGQRVPHPEVGSIFVDGSGVDFSYLVSRDQTITVAPLVAPVNPCIPHPLRPVPIPTVRFLVDANVGKLSGLLRMAGFDTLYYPEKTDAQLAEIAAREQCIVLSRDIGLLKRKNIIHGHYVWSTDPRKQLLEILELYDLKEKVAPFSRCMLCNSLLISVPKEQVLDRLEPLTRKYYEEFYHCIACDKLYWAGSHKVGMTKMLGELLN